MDDEAHDRYMKKMFAEEERTDHRGVLPAKDRIKQYKVKQIKPQRRNLPSAIPGAPHSLDRQLRNTLVTDKQSQS